MGMHLFMIDGIGPFFRGYRRRRINWSKIPFENLETGGRLDQARFDRVAEDFDRFAERVSALGFNAVSLDDLAHLTPSPLYPPELRDKLEAYAANYRRLFESAARHGLEVYVTTDVMFFTPELERRMGGNRAAVARFLGEACEGLFSRHPEVKGVILRIGESDGVDVSGDFKSRLLLRTPAQARNLIKALLPTFERLGRNLVFRTWSVGAYRIGDLMWNRETFKRTFRSLNSDRLILSLKYGETDFYRHLPLNRQFFRSQHKKIIELQTRREYEGFGEFPSFVGWDYEAYQRQLADRDDVVGAWIWCQTGGWSSFRRLTFLSSSSLWNELNTEVTLRVFRDGLSADEAIEAYRRSHRPEAQPEAFRAFLRLSDEVITDLLYIQDFSQRKIFFRRLRVPPLVWVFWDNIVVTYSMRKLLRCFVFDGETRIREGYSTLEKIRKMQTLARELGLPEEDLRFQYDTFELLAASREYFFRPYNEEVCDRLRAMADAYRARHPNGYTLLLDFAPSRLSRRRLKWLMALCLRYERGYRLLDHLFTLRLLGLLHPLVRRLSHRHMPAFATRQAMGIDTVLK